MIFTNKFLHNLFRFTVFLKGINGLFELSGSMVLFFINSRPITLLINSIFYNELAHDPNDFLANLVVNVIGEMSRSTRLFGATVLLILGLINISLVIGLWREKFWVYPTAGFVLMGLIIYQIGRFSHTGSIFLFFLTLLDVAIVFLTFREYIHHKNRLMYKKGLR